MVALVDLEQSCILEHFETGINGLVVSSDVVEYEQLGAIRILINDYEDLYTVFVLDHVEGFIVLIHAITMVVGRTVLDLH